MCTTLLCSSVISAVARQVVSDWPDGVPGSSYWGMCTPSSGVGTFSIWRCVSPYHHLLCLCGAGTHSGAYPYIANLLTLASRTVPRPLPSVSGWSHIQCPMSTDVWMECLASHPDRAHVGYLVQGLREGFRIGFRHGLSTCRSAAANMQSAEIRPEVISGFLASELAAGRVFDPVGPNVVPLVAPHCGPVIPERVQHY